MFIKKASNAECGLRGQAAPLRGKGGRLGEDLFGLSLLKR